MSEARAKETMVPVLPARDAVHFPGLVNTLHVAREASRRAARIAAEGDRRVLVLSQLDMSVDDPRPSDLFQVGTVSEILQMLPMPDGSLRLALRGLHRARVRKLVRRKGVFLADLEELSAIPSQVPESEALMRECVSEFGMIVQLGKQVPPEAMPSLLTLQDPGAVADAIAHHLPVRPALKQEVLEEPDVLRRLERILKIVRAEVQVLELQQRISQRVEGELGTAHREYYLREQLRAIQNELAGSEGRVTEQQEYFERIQAVGMDASAQAKATAELRRLERMPDGPESAVIRSYLDCILSLPWNTWSEDRLDVHEAARLLDEAHHGLANVKDRILDFLAVRQLNPKLKGPILCFVGPPGVGKTSIGRSIAEALGRQFVRVSLGGVRDEAEIRGHRRTYVGSMPGRLIQGLRTCGTRNPVFMLDEIDKIASDSRGDATSALLEALDPEQNSHFSDHYVETPIDLSEVMFITTANDIDRIPSALRDRMEVIAFPGYTDDERIDISRRFLFPKRAALNGLQENQLEVTDEALCALARDYTREAGVRSLERVVDTLCRKAARQVAEGLHSKVRLDLHSLSEFLGSARHRRTPHAIGEEVGTATGLVVSEIGGGIISIEASLMEPKGSASDLQLTGSLGDVMKESAQAAITYIRANQRQLSPTRAFGYDVHIHVPEGSTPKDGPSAGLPILVALASAFAGVPVRGDLALTGEITLRGKVLPVGGIREKVLAAHREGIRHLVLPQENETELEDVPAHIRTEMTFYAVRQVREALDVALILRDQALVDLTPQPSLH